MFPLVKKMYVAAQDVIKFTINKILMNIIQKIIFRTPYNRKKIY